VEEYRVNRKKSMVIDFDLDRSPVVKISYIENLDRDVIEDMGILCEAIIVLIKAAPTVGGKPDYECMASCIKHLNEGFIDGDTYGEGVKDHKPKSTFMAFVQDLNIVINRYQSQGLSGAEIVGGLEILKLDVYKLLQKIASRQNPNGEELL